MISPAKCEVVPAPKEAYEYFSGEALAAATNSFTVLMGTSLLASSTSGMRATMAMGS